MSHHALYISLHKQVSVFNRKSRAYIQSNLVGFGNILEGCRRHGVKHLVYASSSSVYGGNTNLPFKESQAVNHPVSLYAATKKANELWHTATAILWTSGYRPTILYRLRALG